MAFDPGAERQAITYRQLTREDFRADKPPARTLAHARALGAVLCASIRATPESRFHTRRDGSQVWVAVIDRLRFRAEMERDCSWWNPSVPSPEEARLLEHEQMHFALFEIAARHLNQRTFDLAEQAALD